MTVKYLAGNRLTGSNAERTALGQTTIWSQTGGTLDDTNTSSQLGFGAGIKASHVGIGEAITSFTFTMKTTNTGTSIPLTFGVWRSSNTTTTPTDVFTGTVDNNNDLTGTMTEYTFTGSSTLQVGDTIGCLWGSSAGTIIQQRISPPDVTANTEYEKYTSTPEWSDYGDTNPPNMTVKYLSLNIESGAIYSETDTHKYYWWDGSSWGASG